MQRIKQTASWKTIFSGVPTSPRVEQHQTPKNENQNQNQFIVQNEYGNINTEGGSEVKTLVGKMGNIYKRKF